MGQSLAPTDTFSSFPSLRHITRPGWTFSLVVQEPAACDLTAAHLHALKDRLDALEKTARSKLYSRGFTAENVSATRFLNLRFQGTEVALMIASERMEDYLETFLSTYKREFGFTLSGRAVVVDDVRCVLVPLDCCLARLHRKAHRAAMQRGFDQ